MVTAVVLPLPGVAQHRRHGGGGHHPGIRLTGLLALLVDDQDHLTPVALVGVVGAHGLVVLGIAGHRLASFRLVLPIRRGWPAAKRARDFSRATTVCRCQRISASSSALPSRFARSIRWAR